MVFQRGAATLLITSLLLAGVLMIVMGSYKALSYQMKQSQNEVESRRAHWRAEGGLECAISSVVGKQAIPEELSECQQQLSLDALKIETGTPHIVRASSDFLTLSKAFLLPELQIKSPITTTSHLLVNGGLNIAPHVNQRVSEFRWACTSVRYQNTLYAHSYDTIHPYQATDISRYFPESHGSGLHQCSTTHYTDFSWQLPFTQNDFEHVEQLDVFQEVFNVPRSHWFEVMSDTSLFGYVPNELKSTMPRLSSELPSAKYIENCGQQITNLIKASHELIWVYGSCELSADDLQSINLAIDTHLNGGLILVLHNGIASISGNQALKAMIYHFVSETPSAGFVDWAQSNNNLLLSTLIESLNVHTVEQHRVSYFQNGNVYPLGGLVLDAPDSYALFNNALYMQFNKDVTASAARHFHKVKWSNGSWHDF
ncbi:hypothetical protein G3U99_00510 [Vibrio coralliilyticus OCN008]|uniref:hypothetical protein n=1 Tax=Vibrio coralliilyticus TaxID=190893 RepID=UPI0013F44FA0|nr:hypothetical protein [Vibrio coralliilyticus]QIJ82882.1 hypothetical protein G3U99_00510 [Vibrio coralliilyticus OCN008]